MCKRSFGRKLPSFKKKDRWTVSNELRVSQLADYKKPEDLIGENGLLKQLTKRLVERALQAEMSQQLGHATNERMANDSGNTRNGKSGKTLKVNSVNSLQKFRVIAMASLSPKSSPSTRPAGMGLIKRSCPSMPEA